MDNTESILTSIKKLLGIDAGYTHFDPDLIMHINSVFSILLALAEVSLLWEPVRNGRRSSRTKAVSLW